MSAAPDTAPVPSDQAVIEVTTSFFVLAFVLYFCKAYVCVDGQVGQQKWGAVSIPVSPGRHQVEAWTNYFISPQMGRSAVTVDAAPGTLTRVRWKAPWLIFLKGPIKVTSVEPLGAAPMAALAAPPTTSVAPVGPPATPSAAPPPPAPPATMDQPAVGEVPGPAVPDQAQPPLPGVTSPGFGLTPSAPWAPGSPQPGGRPGPVGPPGWHPDPVGRHQTRWFDGSRWTEHVGDDGVASTDEGIA